jgi:hypothetical protein
VARASKKGAHTWSMKPFWMATRDCCARSHSGVTAMLPLHVALQEKLVGDAQCPARRHRERLDYVRDVGGPQQQFHLEL